MQRGKMHTQLMRYAFGTSVGERGQITIERDIRRELDFQPKDVAVQRIEQGRLVIEFIRPVEPHTRSLAGILGPSPRTPPEPLEIDTAVGGAIADEWREYLAREGGEEIDPPPTTALRRRSR